MRRRITEAIVGVSALILLVLGIPLAIAVRQSLFDAEVVKLQGMAARTLTEIDVPLDVGALAEINRESDAPPPFSVYDRTGRRLFGVGPAIADAVVVRALTGTPASTTTREIVVATAITGGVDEQVIGALRLTESRAGADHRVRVVWLVMAATALAALALGWLIANRLARRLSQPVTDLAAAAARIGDGGTVERTQPSGIGEIDTLTSALAEGSERVNEALARERRFSADVSHQLRTPLTALRLRLEGARGGNAAEVIEPALDDLDRIEETVEHLLEFARDAMPATSTVQLDLAAQQAAERWADRVSARGRNITVSTSDAVTTRGSRTSVAQILDVLVDNALQHGNGDIHIIQRRIAGGGAIDLSDEGAGIPSADTQRIFKRGHGDHHGIGLALARSIAEAEGGRLLLAHIHPTTFSLVLLNPDNGD